MPLFGKNDYIRLQTQPFADVAEDDEDWEDDFQKLEEGTRKRRCYLSVAAIFVGVVTLSYLARRFTDTREDRPAIVPQFRVPHELSQSWGQYAPYFAQSEYTTPPAECRVTQVNILQRHAVSSPPAEARPWFTRGLERLLPFADTTRPEFAFLSNFTYILGVEDLVSYGGAESFLSGADTYRRYEQLAKSSSNPIPFVRTTSAHRNVQSAWNWTMGFASVNGIPYGSWEPLIFPEDSTFNSTLDRHMCPKEDMDSYEAPIRTWESIYAGKAIEHIEVGAPNAGFNAEDIGSLMELCALDSFAKESTSRLCHLFTEEDFAGFDYLTDLRTYYLFGYGAKLGRVQGIGYVNELIARLTGQPVQDGTQTNRSLDGNPSTFPLDHNIYADFTTAGQMTSIFSALGLFKQAVPLSSSDPDPSRTWRASRMVSFASRLVTERLDCGGEAYVRMLVNDDLMPLEICSVGNGMCKLSDFLASQVYAREDGQGDFEECF